MTQDELVSQTVLQNWRLTMVRATKSFHELTDEQLLQPIAPGKNRAYYVLGHLTAVHDRLVPMLRLGERLYPELDEEFITQPDSAVADRPARPAELRAAWAKLNEILLPKLEALTTAEWLERHAEVSEEDFAKEPHRNRLAVVLNRTGHVAYHVGQIRLIG